MLHSFPQSSLSRSLRTRIVIIATTLLLLDHCHNVWQRLINRKSIITNSLQDLPMDWEPAHEEDISFWIEYLDDPIVQINCADHLDRCLAHDYQQS